MKYLLLPFLLLIISYGMFQQPQKEPHNSVRIKQIIDLKNGDISNFNYDSAGRLLTISRPGSMRGTSYHYERNYLIKQEFDSLGHVIFADSLSLNGKGLAVSAVHKSLKARQMVNIVNGVMKTSLEYDTINVILNYHYNEVGQMIRGEEFNDGQLAHVNKFIYEKQNLVKAVDSTFAKSSLSANKKTLNYGSFMWTQVIYYIRDTNHTITTGNGNQGIFYFGIDSHNPLIDMVTVHHKGGDTTSRYMHYTYGNEGRAITKVSCEKFNQNKPIMTDSISIVYF
jgi:hypothetical protein